METPHINTENLSEEELQTKTEAIYNELIQMPEIAEALNLLDQLPENLKYHNKAHTLDVLYETVLFAVVNGASQRDIEISAIAAAWHDVGYVEQYEQNEGVAVELFKQSTAFQKLSPEEQNEIISIILDTQMVMKEGKPHLLQQKSRLGYVLDADVSNFGRTDYFEKRQKVSDEIGLNLDDVNVKRKFFNFAKELLVNHDWKTGSARKLRQSQKEENLKKLLEEIEGL
jgi:hypothetical protein